MVAHILYGIYTTGMAHGKPWIAQSTEAQQLNRTDRQLFTLNCTCRQCMQDTGIDLPHYPSLNCVFTFASSGFPQLPSNCHTVKPPSHPAIKPDAHKSHTSTIMLKYFYIGRFFLLEPLPCEGYQSFLYLVPCTVLSKCKKFQAVSA